MPFCHDASEHTQTIPSGLTKQSQKRPAREARERVKFKIEMMNNCTIQQQPEIGDLYAQEDKPDQELNQGHQEEEEGEAQAYEDSISVLPRLSNLSCFGSPTGTTTNHLSGQPFLRCSAHNLPRPGPGMKRRLPFSELKTQKQLMLEQEQEDLDYTLRGFTKINLPAKFSGTRFSRSPERRMPISSTPPTPSPAKGCPLPVQQHGSSTSVPVPPLPPLRRTSSDPTPASIYNVEESLNSRRIKRMRNQIKEMSEWWDRVLRAQEEEYEISDEHNNSATKEETGAENDTQESVSVEVVGKCLSVHFCCPCGKGYQILLSGRNCFYKLV